MEKTSRTGGCERIDDSHGACLAVSGHGRLCHLDSRIGTEGDDGDKISIFQNLSTQCEGWKTNNRAAGCG